MAYGNAVPDQILTAKGLGPKWAITWANVMVSEVLSLGSWLLCWTERTMHY